MKKGRSASVNSRPPPRLRARDVCAEKHTGIPLLSFFSGAGFLDIGFLKAGFEIVWHNECHASFIRAYESGVAALGYNSGSEKIQSPCSVEDVPYPTIINDAFGGSVPDVFGVVGGPPCPDFSIAGKQNGGSGENGRLTEIYVDRILDLNPTFFLLENVPGLIETGKHRTFLFQMLRRLSAKFALDVRILNALDYGVPQDRRRLFVVGFALPWLQKKRRTEFKSFVEQSGKIAHLNVSAECSRRDIATQLEKLHWFAWPTRRHKDAKLQFFWPAAQGATKRTHFSSNAPDHLTVGFHFSRINGHANAEDMFRPKSPKFQTIAEGDVSRKSFKRLHRNRFSPNAAYGNNEVHLHPFKPRRLSVAEALVLQSVPPKYSFPTDITLTDKFKAVGNGVPVKLAERMAKSILKFIEYKE